MNGRISYEMTFDAGHRIVGHKGKCARLHGHTYKVSFDLAGKVVPPGFVVDFGDIKEVVNEWDHMMLLWAADPLYTPEYKKLWQDEGVIWTAFNPTAENMADYLAHYILQTFDLDYVGLVLHETPKCAARVEVVR